MTAYKIYIKIKGTKSQRLISTQYRKEGAIEEAGYWALKGYWTSIVRKEEEDPSRWD